jgi:hypothetical protein
MEIRPTVITITPELGLAKRDQASVIVGPRKGSFRGQSKNADWRREANTSVCCKTAIKVTTLYRSKFYCRLCLVFEKAAEPRGTEFRMLVNLTASATLADDVILTKFDDDRPND